MRREEFDGKIMNKLIIQEKRAKSLLNRSRIFDYCLNPYTGCQFGCAYCYARLFIPRYSGHREPWGSFVDVKINAAERLAEQLPRFHRGKVWVSSVCDPYQPVEKSYELTRRCLEILLESDFPVVIQTKSTLILRDLRLLQKFTHLEVGLTITTDDEVVAAYFEPAAPPPEERIAVLAALKGAGLRTFAFIGPILPGDPVGLVTRLAGRVDWVYLDKLNYGPNFRSFYQRGGWEEALTEGFFQKMKRSYLTEFSRRNIPVEILF